MRGLFPRIFLSFWLAMTLVGVAFGLLYAASSPGKFAARRAALTSELLRAQGEVALHLLAQEGRAAAAKRLGRFEAKTEVRAVVFPEGGAPLGDARLARVHAALARSVAGRNAPVRRELEGHDLVAVPLTGAVVVGVFPRLSRWERFLGPTPLSLRLFVVFVVAGLLSFALARVLTRPLSHLRGAAQRLAAGDLSVRVSPQLGRASEEVSALGRDFDRMAERIAGLLEAQQRLLRDVSHELRSPLARLHVALELARQRAGEGATAPLDRIEREAERLGELIGQILTVTRLDALESAGQDEVDLGALLAEVVQDADYEGSSERRTVELTAEPDCLLTGNAEVLRWAVENVLRNAVRFAPPGSAVEVRLTRAERAGRPTALLTVRDHGPGVPEAERTAIFQPFYRIGTARDRQSGGAGVGLAITDRGVRLHGGTVRAENAPGGGLLVTLELPLDATRAAGTPDPSKPATRGTTPPSISAGTAPLLPPGSDRRSE